MASAPRKLPIARIPGTHSGVGSGGEPQVPKSLPPRLKLKSQTDAALLDAQAHSRDQHAPRTYDVQQMREIAREEAAASGQSAKMAAVRHIERHERSDKRVLAFWTAVAVAFVGGLSMIGKSIVDNAGRQTRIETKLEATRAAAVRVEALLRPVIRLNERLEAEQNARRRDVDRLEAKIDRLPIVDRPDVVTAAAPEE